MTRIVKGQGMVLRDVDGRMLRTKIVATLGSPAAYREGIMNLDGDTVPPEEITYRKLVTWFCQGGVDVIRLNLAHVDLDDIEAVYGEIREAILAFERQTEGEKRVAMLVDLPGPKIRFDLARPLALEGHQPFTVHFDRHLEEEGSATVFINDRPLRQAMADLDGERCAVPTFVMDEHDAQAVENVLGGMVARCGPGEGTFERMMATVGEQLLAGGAVEAIIGDGDVVMEVDRARFDATSTAIPCIVTTVKGDPVWGHKAFTLKGIDMHVPSFTSEDESKLDRVLAAEYAEHGDDGWEPMLTFVGLSFAQTADDVMRLRQHMEAWLADEVGMDCVEARIRCPSVIAKFETRRGWDNRHYILDVADGAMVARGDLGLQLEIEDMPSIQKRLIRLCNKRGKPVITATEMLKSMMTSIEPMRSEATDVFNAITDGSDAAMTSDETSKGGFPLHALRKLVQISERAENYYERQGQGPELQRDANLKRFQRALADDFERIKVNARRFRGLATILTEASGLAQQDPAVPREVEAAIAWRLDLVKEKIGKTVLQEITNRITQATCTMSESASMDAILAPTTSGRTARMVSRLRPSVLIVGAAHDVINARKLALSYGVLPIHIGPVPPNGGTEAVFDACCATLRADPRFRWLAQQRAQVVFTAGTPLGMPGSTNLLQITRIR